VNSPIQTIAPEGLQAALLAAGQFFAHRQVYGLAWIDRDLVVRARYGEKAQFISVGQPITDSVFAFIGSEDFIASFQSDPSLALELPGIVIVTQDEERQRYNLSLFWSPVEQVYLLLVARASLDATLEVELLRHVRARLMAEAETQRKSGELARANRDLEDFAAIISHDLKAPMRALHYMTDDVEAALNGRDALTAATKIDEMRVQTRRLSSMLTGLLDYSSIGRKSEALERVDTHALVMAIVASIARPAGFQVRVVGDWPELVTLKAPFDLVVRNLLENAIKHHDREQGHVELTCHAGDDALLIGVRDDGPGIDEAHRDAIFLPFRTLAVGSPKESDGVGLGLALVQRTVENVGGSLVLRPAPAGSSGRERGAQFDLIWPRELSAKA
jgi:signal transduction histidine kinase